MSQKSPQKSKTEEEFLSFCETFRCPVPKYSIIGNEIYLKDPGLDILGEKISKKIGRTPFSTTTFLGKYDTKQRRFTPSFPFLETSTLKSRIKVNSKGEWLFICKKNLLEGSILNAKDYDNKSKLDRNVIVINAKDEVLGIGRLRTNDDKLIVQNYLDRGNFLRRERQ